MADTRATVSLSPEAGTIAIEIKERFKFADVMEVAAFGAAVAIAQELTPTGGRKPGPARGTWNLGSLDRDGELRALVSALYPDIEGDPAIALETLMDKGLLLLGQLVSAGDQETITTLVLRAGAQPPASS
jgi:hypothetical protein